MRRILLILGFISLLMLSCEGEFIPTELDGKVDLTFPLNVQVCPEGEFIGNNQIRVPLIWKSETDFSTYRVTIKNSQGEKVPTNIIGKKTDTTVTLERGTLYYWFVSGLRGKEVIPSEEWSFYTQGDAESDYVPYPALIQVNSVGENVTISWVGKDEDTEDTLLYDVFLSSENPPKTPILERTELTSYSESFAAGTTYYVQVVTRDNANNISKSQIINFRP